MDGMIYMICMSGSSSLMQLIMILPNHSNVLQINQSNPINPIQSNLYCENTADRTQLSNSVVKKKLKKRKSQVMRKSVLKSVGVFIQVS